MRNQLIKLTIIAFIVMLALCDASASHAAKPASLNAEQVYSLYSPYVVVVLAGESFGSGVAIDGARVITNCHVVENDPAQILVINAQGSFAAQVTGVGRPHLDLCELEVDGLSAPRMPIATLRDINVGERVFAIGHPRMQVLTISEGIVSQVRPHRDLPWLIQTTAPISPGSSGGALFDDKGRLVGITTASRIDGQNLNFATPAQYISLLPELTLEFIELRTKELEQREREEAERARRQLADAENNAARKAAEDEANREWVRRMQKKAQAENQRREPAVRPQYRRKGTAEPLEKSPPNPNRGATCCCLIACPLLILCPPLWL